MLRQKRIQSIESPFRLSSLRPLQSTNYNRRDVAAALYHIAFHIARFTSVETLCETLKDTEEKVWRGDTREAILSFLTKGKEEKKEKETRIDDRKSLDGSEYRRFPPRSRVGESSNGVYLGENIFTRFVYSVGERKLYRKMELMPRRCRVEYIRPGFVLSPARLRIHRVR